LSAAEALRRVIAAPLPPADCADYEQTLAHLHTSLSPELFAAAWQLGQSMALADIVGSALTAPYLPTGESY
jgi:hypothetical protein